MFTLCRHSFQLLFCISALLMGLALRNAYAQGSFMLAGNIKCFQLSERLTKEFRIVSAEEALSKCLGERDEFEKVMQLLREKSRSGSIEASQFLADIYMPNKKPDFAPIKKSYRDAIFWLERAASVNDKYALLTLAELQSDGTVPRDFNRAADHLLKFVALGGGWYPSTEGGSLLFHHEYTTWERPPTDPYATLDTFDRSVIRAMQVVLINNGYLEGAPDAIVGPATEDALTKWAATGLSRQVAVASKAEIRIDAPASSEATPEDYVTLQSPANPSEAMDSPPPQDETLPAAEKNRESQASKKHSTTLTCFNTSGSTKSLKSFAFGTNVLKSKHKPGSVASIVQTVVRKSRLGPRYAAYPSTEPIGTACAMRDSEAQPMIVFDEAWLETYSEGNYWIKVGVIAHEIGHLVNGHGPEDHLHEWRREHEADVFLGGAVAALGGTLEQALLGVSLQPVEGDEDHPPRSSRKASVQEGYHGSDEQ